MIFVVKMLSIYNIIPTVTEVAWDASVNHHKHKESQKTSKTNLFEGRDSQGTVLLDNQHLE